MFIRIKAQSNDLEKQYIKERDIFKKKRKGPKLLLAGLLSATVGGYFYYLNSGSLPLTKQTSIASTAMEQNSVLSTETENQPQLITEALASDEFKQADIAEDSSKIGTDLIQSGISSAHSEDDTLAETSTEEANAADAPSSAELIADVNATGQPAQGLAAHTTTDIENNHNVEEPAQEQLIEPAEADHLIANDSENDISSATATEVKESIITQTNINAAESIVANSNEEVQAVEKTVENFQSNDIEDEPGSSNAAALNEETETITAVNEQNQTAELTQTTSKLELPANEQKSIIASEPEFAGVNKSDSQDITDDIVKDEILSSNIDQQSNSLAPASSQITDQFIAAVSPEPVSTSTVEKVKESRPIKAISNMISNVFANGNDDNEQELAAAVVEIDFSKITNPEQGQERIAMVTVTDFDDADAYQGSSIEELTRSSSEYESIDAALDEVEVNAIVKKEKQLNTAADSASIPQSIESLFEGVDSVAAASIPAITPLENKSKAPEVVSVKTEQNKIDTVAQAAGTDAKKVINKNKSSITIKDLYDQLMTDLDNKETVSAGKKPAIEKSNEKITVKQPAKPVDVAIEKTEISAVLPTNETKTKIEIKIDPDKSLAMTDPAISKIQLDPIEEKVIHRIDNSNTTEEDEILLESNIETASINTKQLTDSKGSTPLMIAAANNDLQTVRELVQQGAQINKRNDWGWTALLNASIKGNRTLVEYLLKNGASPHLADKDGRSPLMAAVLNNHPEILKLLLNYNADVNMANRDGWTALSFAAWKGNAASVKYLLEANAFKKHRTSEGQTALQLAKQGGHTEVVNLLSL